ncbi:hypothetical protein [Bradyrhizobium jicamae]|uniref:hypothetical protein n=1 Tax=Bradyrhizobium jicamae TaxID=280332 RepID=UPI0009FA0812|nr:hypothetical protein [Bradyrhizobium jicamae]
MISEDLAAMRTHRNRIHYYRRLLEAQLTEPEREYFETRLSEERCGFEDLKAAIFPLVFTMSDPLRGCDHAADDAAGHRGAGHG